MAVGWLKYLGRVGRELHLIRVQLTRLADVAEGKSAAPPPEAEESQVSYVAPADRDLAYRIEERLRDTLKRDPTPEEILQELDGLEWGAGDVVQRRR